MKLYSLKLKGFRRIQDTEVRFGDGTFLIGGNNAGKSSVLRALEYLLSGAKQIPFEEFYAELDPETGTQIAKTDEIIFEAEFRNLPTEAETWRGFKGRILRYSAASEDDSGLSVRYRKTYKAAGDCKVELQSLKRIMKPEFEGLKIAMDLIDNGVEEETVLEVFGDRNAKLTVKAGREKLGDIDDIWELENSSEWDENPGGIMGVVLKRLPKFLLIKEDINSHEIENPNGALGKVLGQLFTDVRGDSVNYEKAQEFLNKLADELDPANQASEFGKLMLQLNTILQGVFPNSEVHATADLTDPDKALKPSFNVSLSSNVRTTVGLQGSGMVRSVVFAFLRFRQQWLAERNKDAGRGLIIGFEEPEIYLHPSAANQMRNTIYELSGKNSQIIATTHSPFLIDLSRKPRQVLNRMKAKEGGVVATAFNVTDRYRELEGDDRNHLKMLLRVDDHISRVFFTSKVIVVEGDTEDVVFREALRRLEISHKEHYLRIIHDFEIIKARGKAAIIALAKYLIALGVDVFVIHDRDKGTEGAEVFNQPIADAVGDVNKVIQLNECLEDELGIPVPTADKPFKAYKHTLDWPESWDGVPARIKEILGQAFDGYLDFEPQET